MKKVRFERLSSFIAHRSSLGLDLTKFIALYLFFLTHIRVFGRGRLPRPLFRQGRHYERRVDALALRADEGRGIAAISAGERRARTDPAISEWGNPTAFER